ncbi:MAG: hypothetical protein MSC31_16200 [Solirubrobacteraceae bacterium MAG38_C4-C5]|nr:hypothetical protein [Candidatus Siliceabacter maunaloa]
MRLRAGSPLPAVALAVALVACGGGDGDGDGGEIPARGGGDTPAGGQFAAQANAICLGAKEQIVAVQRRTPDEPEDLRGGLEQLGAVLQDASDRLAELERPDGDAGEVAERYVEELARRTEQTPKLIDTTVDAVEAQDTGAVEQATQRLDALGTRGGTGDLARRLGATECAE